MDKLLLEIKSTPKVLNKFWTVKRFNCGHTRATAHPHPATIYFWDIHEQDHIVDYAPPTSYNIHACELIEVYQERKSIKRYYIIKDESLPVTIVPLESSLSSLV
jgi:hypothetical protein